MKKRLIGSLLMGALLVSSTSVFVSCKDYDDDINNIVATKADKTELEKAKADLEAEIGSLKGRLSTAEGNIQTLTHDLTTLTDNYNDFLAGDFATVKGKVTTLEGNVTDLQNGKADKATYAGKIFNLIDEIERAVAAENALDGRLQTAERTLTSINQTLAQKLDKKEFDDSITSIYAQLEALSTGLGGALERIGKLEKGLKDSCLAHRAVLADYNQQLITLNNFKADFDANYKEKITDAYTKANAIYADYLKTADKNALLDSIRNRYNVLNTKIADKVKYLNDSIDVVANNLKTSIAELSNALADSLRDHRDVMAGLRRDVNSNNAAIIKLNEELSVLNVLLKNTLRGLVFRPEGYYLGIEAMTIHALATGYFHYDVPAISTTIPEAKAEKEEARGYKEEANFRGYGTAAPRGSHGAARYDSTGIFYILPTQAEYHLNPSNADLSGVKKVALLDDDKPYVKKTRSSAAGLTCDPSIEKHDWTSEYGILKVNIDLDNTSRTNLNLIKDAVNDGEVTVFATQLTLANGQKDTTITSDYAAVIYDSIKDLRLAHLNVGYLVENTHCGACALATAAQDHRSHLMATVAEAAHFAPQDSVAWNDSIDLKNLIETHYTSTASGHKAFTTAELAKYGLSYKFELTEYKVGANQTSESVQAAINGSMFRPQMPTRDGKQQAYGAPQNESTAGRTPIVRVCLMKDNKVLDYGYIRIKISLKRADDPDQPDVYIEYEGPKYKFRNNGECVVEYPSYTDSTTWSITQYDIYNKLFAENANGSISRDEFEANYIISGNYALPVEYAGSTNGSDLQQYAVTVKTDGTYKFEELDKDHKVGNIYSRNEGVVGTGTVTSILRWTLNGTQAYNYFVDATLKKAKENRTPYGVAVKYLSKNKKKYPDFYVIFKGGAADVKWNAYSGAIDYTGKKINEDWFSANANNISGTADAGEDEIHANVYSPEDPRGIARGIADTLSKKLSSVFVQGIGSTYLANIVDSTANGEFAADKLVLKFIFDASNKDKEYKGVDGKTYVISLLNDTTLQAHVKNETTPKTIVIIKPDGLAPSSAKDSINHQVIDYQNNEFADALLNYKAHNELAADVFTAYIGIKAHNTTACKKSLPLTQTPFAVRFMRPITVIPGDAAEIEDANDEKPQTINLFDLVNFKDWRETNFKTNGNTGVDYWKYYNIKAIKIDGATQTNLMKKIKTNLNHAVNEFVALNTVTEDLEITWNDQAPATPGRPTDNSAYGTITYQNASHVTGEFDLLIPIRVEYEWGYVLSTDIKIHVRKTAGSSRLSK